MASLIALKSVNPFQYLLMCLTYIYMHIRWILRFNTHQIE